MAQTALQELIQRLENKLKSFPGDLLPSERGLYDGYLNSLNEAQSLLTKERQIIEQAHVAGVVEGDFSTGSTISDYFIQNFNPIN
jgi:hypothetical protein